MRLDDRRNAHGRSMDVPALNSRFILGTRTDCTSYSDATAHVLGWAETLQSRYVCLSNVHVTMESHDSAEYRDRQRGGFVGPGWEAAGVGVTTLRRGRGD